MVPWPILLVVSFGLAGFAPAQNADQQQSTEPKLPSVRCRLNPTKDAIQWQPSEKGDRPPTSKGDRSLTFQGDRSLTFQGDRSPTSQGDRSPTSQRDRLAGGPTREADKTAKNSEPPATSLPATPLVLKLVSRDAKPDIAMSGDIGASNARAQFSCSSGLVFPALSPPLVNHGLPTPFVLAKSDEQRAIVTKGDVVTKGDRSSDQPVGSPVAAGDKSEKNAELQSSHPRDRAPGLKVATSDSKSEPGALRTGDIGTRNAELPRVQSGMSAGGATTDTWFQIPTNAGEQTGIDEAVVNTTANDSDRTGPQPFAQVLADLARRAQRNFVDPGIPATETIAYNFTDSNLDPWEAFTRLAEIRGYRIVSRGDIVTLARNEQSPVNRMNSHRVKAEVWIWLDQTGKPTDRPGLAVQLAGANVTPNRKPQAVRSLEAGGPSNISLVDAHSQSGDSTLHLNLSPFLRSDGRIQVDLEIENGTPSSNGHKSVTIRRAINRTVELVPGKQVIEVDGIVLPNSNTPGDKQSWVQRWFGRKAPDTASARMIVRLTVPDSEIPADSSDPGPSSDSGKSAIASAPREERRTPEFIVIRNPKH